jgi:hypothetical protein
MQVAQFLISQIPVAKTALVNGEKLDYVELVSKKNV